MKVYFSSTHNSAGATYATVVNIVDCLNVLKDGNCTIMLDGCSRRCYIKMLWKEDWAEWASAPMRMRKAFRVDCGTISPALTINLSKIANMFTPIVWREVTFTDAMQSLQSHPLESVSIYHIGQVLDDGYIEHLRVPTEKYKDCEEVE